MTCYFDSATLYGAYALEDRGYSEFRFQLREDGILLVNGREVKPLEVHLDGHNSWAAVDVGSIVADPKEAAMLALLPPDQKRQFLGMAMQRGIVMTGGLIRTIELGFIENSVVFRSAKGDSAVDIVSQRCNPQ
jgi:hypothetical protein